MNYYEELLREEVEMYNVALERRDLDEKTRELFQRQLEYTNEKLDKIQFFKRSTPEVETKAQ